MIERIDRYNIRVDGHVVRATEQQEARIRAMYPAQRENFLRILGKIK